MDAIYGHQGIKKGLQLAARSKRLHHALLFVGADGVGKMSLARAFVKSMYCLNSHPETGELCACGNCEVCTRIQNSKLGNVKVPEIDSTDVIPGLWVYSGYPDFCEIVEDSAWIKVATMRAVSMRVAQSLYCAPHRYIIMRDAHKLRDEAANAFLKTLEEPNPNTSFILTTSNLNALLPTIVSRCQIVRFAPFSDAEVVRWVTEHTPDASKDNNYDAEQIANMASGSFGEAMKLALGEDKDTIIMRFQQIINMNSSVEALRLASELKSSNAEEKKRFAARCMNPLFRLVQIFLCDIMMRQAVPNCEVKLKHHLELIDKCAKSARPEDVQRTFDNTQDVYNAIAVGNANELIAWERFTLGFQGVLFKK